MLFRMASCSYNDLYAGLGTHVNDDCEAVFLLFWHGIHASLLSVTAMNMI